MTRRISKKSIALAVSLTVIIALLATTLTIVALRKNEPNPENKPSIGAFQVKNISVLSNTEYDNEGENTFSFPRLSYAYNVEFTVTSDVVNTTDKDVYISITSSDNSVNKEEMYDAKGSKFSYKVETISTFEHTPSKIKIEYSLKDGDNKISTVSISFNIKQTNTTDINTEVEIKLILPNTIVENDILDLTGFGANYKTLKAYYDTAKIIEEGKKIFEVRDILFKQYLTGKEWVKTTEAKLNELANKIDEYNKIPEETITEEEVAEQNKLILEYNKLYESYKKGLAQLETLDKQITTLSLKLQLLNSIKDTDLLILDISNKTQVELLCSEFITKIELINKITL